MRLDVQLDLGRIRPEAVKVVKFARFLAEDMENKVAIIQQEPVAVERPFRMQGFQSDLAHLFAHGTVDRLELRLAARAATAPTYAAL